MSIDRVCDKVRIEVNLSNAISNAHHKDDDRKGNSNRNAYVSRSVGIDCYVRARDG